MFLFELFAPVLNASLGYVFSYYTMSVVHYVFLLLCLKIVLDIYLCIGYIVIVPWWNSLLVSKGRFRYGSVPFFLALVI